MRIHATTDNEAQAAAIAQRLIDEEGLNATTVDTADTADVIYEGFPLRSSFRYAVLILEPCSI